MLSEDIIMSQKPYLIRAMYEWMLDHAFTPRIVVSPLVSGVTVPQSLTSQTQITLDISPQAVAGLELGNNEISFEAYFEKEPFDISISMNAIAAIIAKEKEVGYVFDIEDFLPKTPKIEIPSVQSVQSKAEKIETEKSPKSAKTNSKNLKVAKGKADNNTKKRKSTQPKKGLIKGFKNLISKK